MLWAIFAVFLIAWILGLLGAYSIGGWLWVLFALWVAALFAQLLLPENLRPWCRGVPPEA